jgi:hypothetical protein
MKAKPIIEPKEVDLVLEGGDMSEADLKAFRALLKKSQAAIERAQKKVSELPGIDEPVPTLAQLIALQRKQEEEVTSKRRALPARIQEVDESGIGGEGSPQESAYMSAYIWSSQQSKMKTYGFGRTITLAKEPAPPRWTKAKAKTKRTKA